MLAWAAAFSLLFPGAVRSQMLIEFARCPIDSVQYPAGEQFSNCELRLYKNITCHNCIFYNFGPSKASPKSAGFQGVDLAGSEFHSFQIKPQNFVLQGNFDDTYWRDVQTEPGLKFNYDVIDSTFGSSYYDSGKSAPPFLASLQLPTIDRAGSISPVDHDSERQGLACESGDPSMVSLPKSGPPPACGVCSTGTCQWKCPVTCNAGNLVRFADSLGMLLGECDTGSRALTEGTSCRLACMMNTLPFGDLSVTCAPSGQFEELGSFTGSCIAGPQNVVRTATVSFDIAVTSSLDSTAVRARLVDSMRNASSILNLTRPSANDEAISVVTFTYAAQDTQDPTSDGSVSDVEVSVKITLSESEPRGIQEVVDSFVALVTGLVLLDPSVFFVEDVKSIVYDFPDSVFDEIFELSWAMLLVVLLVFAFVATTFVAIHNKHLPDGEPQMLFVLLLGLADLTSDFFFVTWLLGLPEGAGLTLHAFLGISFLGAALAGNSLILLRRLSRLKAKDYEAYDHLRKFPFTAFWVILVSFTNVALLGLFHSYLFGLKAFSGNFKERTRRKISRDGIVVAILEDLPQLVLQISVLSVVGMDKMTNDRALLKRLTIPFVLSSLSLLFSVSRRVAHQVNIYKNNERRSKLSSSSNSLSPARSSKSMRISNPSVELPNWPKDV